MSMLFNMPAMSLERIRSYSNKMIADLQSDPPMIDVHDRELQAHAIIHYLLNLLDKQPVTRA